MKKILTAMCCAVALAALPAAAQTTQPVAQAGVNASVAKLIAPKVAVLGTVSAGSPVSITWTPGSTCGTTVNGQAVTCSSFNVYQCIGDATACKTFSGTVPSAWTQIKVAQTDAGAYTVASPPQAGALTYFITDCATGDGWNGTCTTGPGTGSESVASNTATVTFQPSPPTNAAAQ